MSPKESRWGAAASLLMLVGVLGGGGMVPNCARAEDEIQKAHAEAGQVWYEKYCMPCHGKGGAPGSAVYPDSKQPIDLRTYVQRNGGQFPAGRWFSVVFGPQPGLTHHTDVWNKIRSEYHTSFGSGDIEARGMVASIAQYIMSVQTK